MGMKIKTVGVRKYSMFLVLAGLFVSSTCIAVASDYLTVGADNARSGWLKDEKVISKSNVSQIKLLWKITLPSKPREMHNLFSPLVATVHTSSGPTDVAVVGGVSEDLWGLDVETGETLWSKKLDEVGLTGLGPQGGTLCPGGQTAAPTMQRVADGKYVVWALGGDGRIWQLDAATGEELAPPDKFAPPAGKAYALNLDNDFIYTVQAQGCGGASYQIDAYNTKTRRTTAFYPGGGGLWGRRGVVVDPEGRAYEGTGDGPYDPANKQLGETFFQVKPDAAGELQLLGYFAPPDANYLYKHDLDLNVTPVAFDYMGRKFLLGTSKECRLYLMDRDNMGGGDAGAHREDVTTSGLLCNDRQQYDAAGVWGSPAAYVNSKSEAWVYVPFWGPKSDTFNPPTSYKPSPIRGGVAALTVSQVGGKWQFVPKWLSEDMNMAEEALIANDIVFTYSSGENTNQAAVDQAWDAKPVTGNRIAKSSHATIYALDAQTGKTLWSSGDQITSFNHFSGITVANGRIYIGTYDGTMYCFGIAK
jgi:outer membrane protein assembly factor BamB